MVVVGDAKIKMGRGERQRTDSWKGEKGELRKYRGASEKEKRRDRG